MFQKYYKKKKLKIFQKNQNNFKTCKKLPYSLNENYKKLQENSIKFPFFCKTKKGSISAFLILASAIPSSPKSSIHIGIMTSALVVAYITYLAFSAVNAQQNVAIGLYKTEWFQVIFLKNNLNLKKKFFIIV